MYRVFLIDLHHFRDLGGHLKTAFGLWWGCLYIPGVRTFDLWHLDLAENNIPILLSLSSEWWQNFTWNYIILIKNILFSKHQNKVILASLLLTLRIWVVLKTSVASMTSADIITSLASMTSTASLASKNEKQIALYILSDFPGTRNLNGLNSLNNLSSLNNLGGLNDLSSLISSKKLLSLMFPSNLAPKCPILVF